MSSNSTFTSAPAATNMSQQKRPCVSVAQYANAGGHHEEVYIDERVDSPLTHLRDDLPSGISLMKHVEFNCSICNEKVEQDISKHACEKGVVIVRCSGCENLHLIADNSGFAGFSEVSVEELATHVGDSFANKWGTMDIHMGKK
jgi:protein import protein ZIM17